MTELSPTYSELEAENAMLLIQNTNINHRNKILKEKVFHLNKALKAEIDLNNIKDEEHYAKTVPWFESFQSPYVWFTAFLVLGLFLSIIGYAYNLGASSC